MLDRALQALEATKGRLGKARNGPSPFGRFDPDELDATDVSYVWFHVHFAESYLRRLREETVFEE